MQNSPNVLAGAAAIASLQDEGIDDDEVENPSSVELVSHAFLFALTCGSHKYEAPPPVIPAAGRSERTRSSTRSSLCGGSP